MISPKQSAKEMQEMVERPDSILKEDVDKTLKDYGERHPGPDKINEEKLKRMMEEADKSKRVGIPSLQSVLERKVAELSHSLNYAAGLISGSPRYDKRHPEAVLKELIEYGQQAQKEIWEET